MFLSRRACRTFVCTLLVIIWPLAVVGFVATPPVAEASDRPTLHHDLELEIFPDTHEIVVRDTMVINPQDWSQLKKPFQVSLNRHLTVDEIRIGSKPATWRSLDAEKDMGGRTPQFQVIELSGLHTVPSSDSVHLTFQYKGRIDDPPRSSKNLRFVSPDRTDGYVGPEGVYLTSETAWYPTMMGTLDTFLCPGHPPPRMAVGHTRT